jgi:diguanylate cyclase (GGDEF)-like protein
LFLEDDGNFYIKLADGLNMQQLKGIVINPQDKLFSESINAKAPLILDKQNMTLKDLMPELYEKFRLRNTLAMPVFLKGRVIAVIGIGNARESFLYKKEDIELLDLFAKNISIAIDNDSLVHRVEKLEIKDQATGLYNEAFIRGFLQDEIKRAIAHQRPCALILLNTDNFSKFQDNFGPVDAETAIKKIIYLIRESVSELDRIGRTGDNEFAIVLPEVNKRRAQALAEEIRKKIEFAFSEEPDADRKITISGGVSENPLDGIDSKQLMDKAKELLQHAKKLGRNRVVTFIEP